jgi:acetyl-CoA C-acetyltransferase
MSVDLRSKVAVVGVGCTRFDELYDKSVEDLICDAVAEALADAGCERERIEAAWIGTIASTFGGDAPADALKLFGRPVTRVHNYCASGMDAFRNACLAVAAGMYDVALAVGFEKMRDGNSGRPNRSHPVIDFGERAPHVFALSAHRYFKQYGASKKTLAAVAVKNHANGMRSPKAHLRMPVTEEIVLGAPSSTARSGSSTAAPAPTARRRRSSAAPISPPSSAADPCGPGRSRSRWRAASRTTSRASVTSASTPRCRRPRRPMRRPA